MSLQQDNDAMVPVDILLRFQQFAHMGDIALLDIGTHAEVQHIARGCAVKSEQHSKQRIYLINGEVEIVASDGKLLQRFKSGSERAERPLFRIATPGLKAVAKDKISILVIDAATHDKYYTEQEVVPDGSITFEEVIDLSGVDTSSKILSDITQRFKSEQIDLPSLPDVAIKINKIIQDPNINMSVIANVVRADPVISSRIIQVANSAIYTGQPKTESLGIAITRMGLKVTRSIVYSVILKGLYKPKTPVTQKLMERVYEECIRTGIVSHILCKAIGILDPDQALLAGIIHNIGVIPILIMADKHESLSEDVDTLESIIDELEPNVGAALLGQWGFSDELVTVVREHNDWFREGGDEPDYCDIVQAAKLHCSLIGGEKTDTPQLHEVSAFKKLNLGQIDHNDGIQLLRDAQTNITEMIQMLLAA